MLRYILSFFVQPAEPELSLEQSCDILLEEQSENENCVELSNGNKPFDDENFSVTTGCITSSRNNVYLIDNKYKFESEENYMVGAKVSYHKLVSNGKITIYNVNIMESEWDIFYTKESAISTRVMVCQVKNREGRTFTLTPGDLVLNLDKVNTEFIPVVGDWIEADVVFAVDENAIDLTGQIIEINKISPLRPHIANGTITSWDTLEKSGTINRQIFFNSESLSNGYVPVIGDKIISEVIESEQGKCVWRALKVIPEYLNKKFEQILTNNVSNIDETHPGLVFNDVTLSFHNLSETKQFNIVLSCTSDQQFTLINAEFVKPNSQCTVLHKFDKRVSLIKDQPFEINCECTVRNMGSTSEFLLFTFTDFCIGRWVKIEVVLNHTNNGTYAKKYYNRNYKESGNQIIRGERSKAPNRFQAVRIPAYAVPQRLLELVTSYSEVQDKLSLIDTLKRTKPCLFSNLNPMNYEDRFHSLLHLDEIANIVCIRNYDQERACFIVNNEYLMLEIENLSERRPSIVLGDKIIASDPLGVCKQDYEGIVHKVGAKHIYLRFSNIFHERYNGEDYSIKVVAGRASYKRLHHAIYLVSRNWGKDLLFPTNIKEKEPRVTFTYDPFETTEKSEKKTKPKPLSPREALKKIKERRENIKNGLNNSQSNIENQLTGNPKSDLGNTEKVHKLEWYNGQLNCKQKEAVINILKGVARPLPYIIFGPPGTGKTVTVIETILQILRHIPQSRLLVTAPSNSAADLIALRLIDSGILKPGDLVRLVSVNYAASDIIPVKLLPYCATSSNARESTTEENIVGMNGITYDCSRAVLGRHRITVSTCSSAGQMFSIGFPKGHFTHIIVDEAGQAMEPEVMIPLSFLDKHTGQAILAGDPMQLGPVAMCRIAEECGLCESFLERLINRFPYVKDPVGFPESNGYDPRVVTKLVYNYRSLEPILKLFSDMFYGGDLEAKISSTESKEAILLHNLKEILPPSTEGSVPSVVFHGVNGENYQTADSPSWYNPHEAAQVFYYVNEVFRLGLKADNVGIITPYSRQVKEIKQLLRSAEFDLPRVGTVEDFQGQEFDVILLSTVRSSKDFIPTDIEHSLGFVSSPRRLNVAISRPKSLLIVIGNPNLLCFDTYWRTVIKYCVEKGGYCGCNLMF